MEMSRPILPAKNAASSGQGTVEFTLLLVVVVALVMAFSRAIYKPFGEYANAYMGEYLGCLLDKGILPKLGSEEDECAESMKAQKMNLAQANAELSARNQAESQSSRNKSSEEREVSESRSGQSSSDSSGSSRFSRGRNRGSARSADGGSANDKAISTPEALAESKYYSVRNAGGSSSSARIIQVRGVEALINYEKQKLQKRASRISKAGTVETDEDRGKPKKFGFKSQERSVARVEQEEAFSFGEIFRLLIIVGMLIAIIVVVAGQAVQISKSWEK